MCGSDVQLPNPINMCRIMPVWVSVECCVALLLSVLRMCMHMVSASG